MRYGAPFPFGHESELALEGWFRVAGVDEAGRGPLAGPVVAAAVVFPERRCPDGVADSKALSEAQREFAYGHIVKCAEWAVAVVEPGDIDRLNILRATHLAMGMALGGLRPSSDFALVDGLAARGLPVPHRPIVRGEQASASIAAASIIAKVTRDRLMADLHDAYPDYGFDRHKGYPTPRHLEALVRYGPCPAHRRTFGPVAQLTMECCRDE